MWRDWGGCGVGGGCGKNGCGEGGSFYFQYASFLLPSLASIVLACYLLCAGLECPLKRYQTSPRKMTALFILSQIEITGSCPNMFTGSFNRDPRCGSSPNCPVEAPHQALPSPPSLPLPPTPLAIFAVLPEVAWGRECRAVRGEGPPSGIGTGVSHLEVVDSSTHEKLPLSFSQREAVVMSTLSPLSGPISRDTAIPHSARYF